MRKVTDKQLSLLDAYQRSYFNEFAAKEYDFNIFAVDQQNHLEFVHLESIDELYTFMYSNLRTKIYKKFIPCMTDSRIRSAERSELAIDICQSIIKYDEETRDRHINVLQNVQNMLTHYKDYTIQYALVSKWSGQDEFKYTHSLLEFRDAYKETPHLITMCNQAIYDAIQYVVVNDIDLEKVLNLNN